VQNSEPLDQVAQQKGRSKERVTGVLRGACSTVPSLVGLRVVSGSHRLLQLRGCH